MSKLLRWLPLLILLAGIFCFFYFSLYRFFTFTELQNHRAILLAWQEQHFFLLVFGFILLYVVSTALSLPGAIILTLTGGFLFGIVWGTLFIVVGATIGACLIFLAVKTSLGQVLAAKAGKWLTKLKKGFEHDALSYLLILRLVPIFPFWVINIAAGLLNVRLRIFALTTFFGIIPGTLVYASVGAGLGTILDAGETPNLGVIFTPAILLPLLGLAILSLVPMIYKKIKARKHA